MIDLMKLQAFLYAAESLSFSDAAKQLHLSQPTISHHIKSLEQELGVELFARSGLRSQIDRRGPSAHVSGQQAAARGERG